MTVPPLPLGPDEPAPFELLRASGHSRFVLCCDHAGKLLPRALGTLGLDSNERQRHIAWDIGAAGLARALSALLDAPLILQPYSRLAIDCNRPLAADDSIAVSSEDTPIPGNLGLSAADAQARAAAIFEPYHTQLRQLIDARMGLTPAPLLVSVHSFTPVYRGDRRPWDVGVLYDRDARLANCLLELLRAEQRWQVGDNQPYRVDDEHDYTVKVHAEHRGLGYVELEIRQDLIADAAGQTAWAGHLARLLPRAAAQIADR